MISPIVKMCLATLLNQTPEAQAKEMDALMSDRLFNSQLAQCIRHYEHESFAVDGDYGMIDAQGSLAATRPTRKPKNAK